MRRKFKISNNDPPRRRSFVSLRRFESLRNGIFGGTCLLVFLLGLQGCAGILRPPQDDPEAKALIRDLSGRNPDLTQFKGLFEIRLEAGGQTALTGRAGWAASVPQRLRIEWLNMLGQPLLSLAADGQTITLISHAERRYRRLPQTAASLKQLIKLPVAVEDLIALITGRPLLPDFSAARYTPEADEKSTITLLDRWHQTVATLSLAGDQLRSEQIFSPQGEIRFRIEWLEWQTIERQTIPRRMLLSTPAGERLALSVVRFWPEATFAPPTFFLERPDFIEE